MSLIALAASVLALLTAAGTYTAKLITVRRKASRSRFLAERRAYEAKRVILNHRAVEWYGLDADVIGATSQLTCPGWIPAEPIPISKVMVVDDLAAEHEGWFIQRLNPLMSSQLPYPEGAGKKFASRHEAIESLCRPTLWENRICYRLTSVELESDVAKLAIAPVRFFTGLDVSESLAIELLRDIQSPRGRRLALRQLLGDVCDLKKNPVHAGVATLTIVRYADGVDRFFLLDRDMEAVADGTGQRHVIPAGVFQPSTDHPEAWSVDQDIWKNIVREACEEFLPDIENIDAASAPVDLDTVEPYRSVLRRQRNGEIKCFFLGVGLDPVQLQPEILTVMVIKENTFNKLFGPTFTRTSVRNSEGRIVGAQIIGTTKSGRRLIGFPFTKDGVEKTLSTPLVSGAAACLHLAWESHGTLVPIED